LDKNSDCSETATVITFDENDKLKLQYVSVSSNIANRWVLVENKPFMILKILGDIGRVTFHSAEHGFSRLVAGSGHVIITLKKAYNDNSLEGLFFLFKYLRHKGYFSKQSRFSFSGQTISLKEIKGLDININSIGKNVDLLGSVWKYILSLDNYNNKIKLLNVKLANSLISNHTSLPCYKTNFHYSKDILSFTPGLANKQTAEESKDRRNQSEYKEYRLLNRAFFNNKYKKDDKFVYLSDSEARKLKEKNRFKCPEDTVISLSGFGAGLGKVDISGSGLISNDLFLVLSKDENILAKEYIPYLLNSYNTQSQIRRLSCGTTLQHSMDSKDMLKFQIPDVARQKDIAKLLNNNEKLIFMQEKKKELFEKLLTGALNNHFK
jgi:hypothetical protein